MQCRSHPPPPHRLPRQPPRPWLGISRSQMSSRSGRFNMMLTLMPVCPFSSSRMNWKSPVALRYPPHHLLGAGKERTVGESARETVGNHREPDLSGEDAAELEELRREAAILREQLETAVETQSAARSARDVHQLEARIDSLAARNSKLMETLKEARQQLLALREEVDRLGQPPSGYGVLLSSHDDETVDVFTSGRKMRLTCSPNIDVGSLRKGQTVRLNEALTVVEAGMFESVGEISTLREVLNDGHRALVVGHADEERIVWLSDPLGAVGLAVGINDGPQHDTGSLTVA